MKELSTKVERLAELEQAITEINEAPVKVQTELVTSILEVSEGNFPNGMCFQL